jgi:hypothetical protein
MTPTRRVQASSGVVAVELRPADGEVVDLLRVEHHLRHVALELLGLLVGVGRAVGLAFQ